MMLNHRAQVTAPVFLLTAALVIGLAGCASDDAPTEAPLNGSTTEVAAAESSLQFGPFPGGTTIYVDVDNGTGIEDGSRTHPFDTIREALAAAGDGDAVGVAPGLYAESAGPSPIPLYVIDGLRNFKLVGWGPVHTTIRGDHSASLIRVQNGASALIKGFTIEQGGSLQYSEGGGIQVIGLPNPVTLTLTNLILRNNEAVNGGAISAERRVTLRLVNVLIANNRANNAAGGVYLSGTHGSARATFTTTTITGNNASYLAGGVLVERAQLDMVNSIVWNNRLAEVARFTGEERVSVRFSDVGERLFPGPGNLSADPLFFAPGRGDYRLRRGSPAVDAGTNTGAPATDVRRQPRPFDGDGDGVAVTDMGAFEFAKVISTGP